MSAGLLSIISAYKRLKERKYQRRKDKKIHQKAQYQYLRQITAPALRPLPLTMDRDYSSKVLFSFPYKPGSDPVPVRQESAPVPVPSIRTQEELNELLARYNGFGEFLANTRNAGVQNQRDPDLRTLRTLRDDVTRFNGGQPQVTWDQQQIDRWNATGHELQTRINAWNDRQQELERQRDIIAQRYTAEINNFAQGSETRRQEVTATQQQVNTQRRIMNESANFDSARPEGVLTQQQLDNWNQTGRTLQRSMDTWMTGTNPRVVAYNPQKPSSYSNPGSRGNSTQGSR